MFLTIYIIITILAMLLFSGLYIVVSISRPQTELRRIFRWYLLAMFLWSLVSFLLYVDQTEWDQDYSVNQDCDIPPIFDIDVRS